MIKVFIKKEKTIFFTIEEKDIDSFIAEASLKYSINDKIVDGVRTINLTQKKQNITLKEAIELL